jgi:CRISPR-associated protein Cst1
MLTGEGILNFFPGCTGGLPISGPYLTALQALPLGGRRMEGRLLIANSDHPALTVAIARRFLDDNRRLLAMAKAGRLPGAEGFDEALPRELASWDAKKKHPKYPDAKGVRSIILSELMEIWGQRSLSVDELGMASLTVYWLTNSGQGPAVDIFQLPSNLLRFLALADGGVTRGEWRRRVAGAWLPLEEHPGGAGRSHNRVLTDLLRIYEAGFIDLSAAGEFVRRHLLAKVEARIGEDGHDRWALTYLFLKEVMGMDERRVEAIRTFADRLAAYIQERNDRPFFRSIIYAGKPADLRMSFVKAQRDEARKNGRLLFGLDEYIQVFEAEDNLGRLDWRLVRDLLSVRVVEQLHRAGFLAKEDLEEPEETVSQTEEG